MSRYTAWQKIRQFGLLGASGAAVFTGAAVVFGNEKFYSEILMPIGHKFLDPEVKNASDKPLGFPHVTFS